MRRALVFTTALFAVSAAAGAAAAQQAETNSTGLRYLSWPGKTTASQPAASQAPAPQPATRQPAVSRSEPALRPAHGAAMLDAPSAVPLARIAPAGREAPRPGLTPATAFYNPTYGAAAAPSNTAPQAYATGSVRQSPPQAAPVAAPTPAPVQQPTPQVAHQPAPQPAPQPTPRPAPATAVAAAPQPETLRQQQAAAPTQAQAPAQTPVQAPAPAAVDPLAPRRDALIFSLQRNNANSAPAADAPQATPSAEAVEPQQVALQASPQAAPYGQQARYYSVHRQAGRHPDAIAAPQQSYLNALPVELTQMPASKDMAEPEGPPQLIRDANGRIRAMPQSQSDETP